MFAAVGRKAYHSTRSFKRLPLPEYALPHPPLSCDVGEQSGCRAAPPGEFNAF